MRISDWSSDVCSSDLLGYRKLINHYVGMSHYFRLGWNAGEERFVAQAAGDPLNAPCRRWHEDFAARAKALNYNIIWSLSYELFDAHAPEKIGRASCRERVCQYV